LFDGKKQTKDALIQSIVAKQKFYVTLLAMIKNLRIRKILNAKHHFAHARQLLS
jgi:hypothetical protein